MLNSEEDITPSDCEECGNTSCVSLEEDHPYFDPRIPIKMVIPTFVCQVCGDESYSNESYKDILQEVERIKGKPYMKIEVQNGRIIRYAIH